MSRLILRDHFNPQDNQWRQGEDYARVVTEAVEVLADIETGGMQPPASARRFVIGIDPGAKSGFAVWDRMRRVFVEIRTLDFWRIYDHVTHYYRPHNAEIVIEASHLINTTYDKRRSRTDTERTFARKNRNVGMNQAHSKLLSERFSSLGYAVREVKPTRATRTKMPTGDFERLTGYRGSTSEHGRDAAMLVYQR